MPGPIPLFDRVDEQDRLTQLLLPEVHSGIRPANVALVLGPGGCGKSALVHNWAHANACAFPGGQLYTDLAALGSGPAAVSETLSQWLLDLGVDTAAVPASVTSRTALLRTATHCRSMIAVIDGADHSTDLRPLLLSPNAGVTVITARMVLPELVMAGAKHFAVPPLPADAAEALLGARVGPDRAQRESDAIAALIRTFDGHAYTISLAGVLLELHPDWQVARVVRSFTSPSFAPASIATTWETMLMTATKDLPADAAAVLAVLRRIAQPNAAKLGRIRSQLLNELGRVPTPDELAEHAGIAAEQVVQIQQDTAGDMVITDEAAAVILGQPADPPAESAVAAVAELVRRGLARNTSTADQFAVSAMVLQHSTGKQSLSDEDTANAVKRLAAHYLRQTARAVLTTEPGKLRHSGIDERDLTPFADEPTAFTWFNSQLRTLMAIFGACHQLQYDELVVRSADVLWPMHRQSSQYELQLATQRAAAAAAKRSNHPFESLPLTRSGWALAKLGQPEAAVDFCTQGLQAAERCPKRHFAAAAAMSTRSEAYADLGRYDLADIDIDQAAIQDKLNDSPPWVRGLRKRRKGRFRAKLGHRVQGLRLHEESIELTAPDPRRPKETARAYLSCGELCNEEGRPALAVGALCAALDIFSRHPHAMHQARTHEQLARAYKRLGMDDSCAAHIALARALYHDLGRPDLPREVEDREPTN